MDEFEIDINNIVQPNKWQQRKYFLRQILVSSGGWTCYFIMGMFFGSPTVFIPQIRQEANSTEAVSESTASWIPAITVYSGVPWILIMPIVMEYVGRKYSFTFVCVSNLISFIVFYLSTTVNHIIISEVINGINTGSHFTVSAIIITEYTSPIHRGVFLTAKSASLFWGMFMANAIGTFFHWTNIGIAGIVCSIYSLIVAFLLPESPLWLAKKQRFEESAASYRWMMGEDKKTEADLVKMIRYQKNLNLNTKSTNFQIKGFIRKYYKIVSSVQFYKPLFLCFLLQSLYVFTGKVVFIVYAIDIISKITAGHNMSAYTAMLILDGVTVFFMYIGCIIAQIWSRRKLLISSSLIGIGFLLSISLYGFLIKLSFVNENNYIAVLLLSGYSIGIGCGPVILTNTISGELVSLESRGLSSCCIDLCLKILLGTLVKISPCIFKNWGPHGGFLFYGVSTSIFLFLIYKFLPETKDKSLQEIAEIIKGSGKIPRLQEESKILPKYEKNIK